MQETLPGSIPGLGKFSGEGNGNPLQYSCLENFTDREAWWYSLWGLKESDTTERLTQTHKTKLGSKVMVFYNVIFLPLYMLHMVVSLRSKFIYGILFCEVDIINSLHDYSE